MIGQVRPADLASWGGQIHFLLHSVLKRMIVPPRIRAGGRNRTDMRFEPRGILSQFLDPRRFPIISKTYKSSTHRNKFGKPWADLGYFRFPRLHFGYTFFITEISSPSFPSSPAPVSIDPFRPLRFRLGQWQVDDRNPQLFPTSSAYRHNLSSFIQIDSLHPHLYPQHCSCERNRQVFLEHCEDAGDFLGLIVAVHCGLLNQLVKMGRAGSISTFSGSTVFRFWSLRHIDLSIPLSMRCHTGFRGRVRCVHALSLFRINPASSCSLAPKIETKYLH